jgi:hypothetical protein
MGRSVRQARLRAPEGTSRYRAEAAIEEALRLCVLPGEEEGKVYYFRRVRIAGLPPCTGRRAWLDQFQRALWESAAGAVQGAEPRAEAAPAVFFRSRQEALELLLHRMIAGRPAVEWFWPAVVRGEEAASSEWIPSTAPAMQAIPAIVELLRATEAGWVAVAAAIFGAPRLDAVRLLQAIPDGVAEAWLGEIGGESEVVHGEVRPRISAPALQALRDTLRAFRSGDARTLWLTVLAVLHESPSELAAGKVLERARGVLRNLAPEAVHPRGTERSFAPPRPAETARPDHPPAGPDGCTLSAAPDQIPTIPAAAHAAASPVSNPWFVEWLPTRCAGLFFLLNVLRPLGIEDALAELSADFVPRLLERLAAYAGAAEDDPIVLWLASLRGEDPDAAAARLLRKWAVDVRRWCWRTGKITAREIVARDGGFHVNRTDLDVSLPLDEADVRVRRIGLDLDPGWLPWFGRVVRFHYDYRSGRDD